MGNHDRIFERSERKSLIEMSRLTSKNDSFRIDIHSDDHVPPHFHFYPVDKEWVLKLYISDPLKIYQSTVRKGVCSGDLLTWKGLEDYKKSLSKWLEQSHKGYGIKNKDQLKIMWDSLHPDHD